MKFKTPRNKDSLTIERSPVKKNVARWQWYLVIACVLAPLVYVLWMVFSDNWFIVAKGNIVTQKYLIRAHEDSFVDKNFIHDGDILQKGEQVFELKSPILETELAEINDQLIQLNDMQAKLYEEDLDPIKHMFDTSKKYVDINKKFYQAMIELRKDKVINLVDLQRSSQVLHSAEMELEKVKVDKLEYALGKDTDFENDIRALEFRKALIVQKLDSLDIRMDVKAIVQKDYVYRGEFVQKGQELAMLSLFSKPYVRAYLDSKYISYVKQGSLVTIEFQDGKSFPGKIVSQVIFAEADKDRTNIFDEAEPKVVMIVEPVGEIPQGYSINSVPVDININRL